MNAYSTLAHFYELFTSDDCDYNMWSQYVDFYLSCTNAAKGADLACGTGKMTRLLAKAGYSVVGMDSNPQMLDEAVRKGGKCRYVLQDIRRLNIPAPIDFATCINDGVNYLTDGETQKLFCDVYACLNDGGVFIFDISTAYKLRSIVADNVFYVDDDDATCLWTNKLDRNKVQMDVTVFKRAADGRYTRGDERHIQYIHDILQLEQQLKSCGFSVNTCDEYNKDKQITDTTQRATFCCIKEKI
ncbi:MAG: class I SAM-dependent methyltransferase [Corallococcus sp.]|nr:class I SAM-dependent methyltransferase [Corallococcus sp.]